MSLLLGDLGLQPLSFQFRVGNLSLQLLNQQAKIAASFIGQFVDFLRFGPVLLGVSVGLLLPHVEFREAASHDLANRDEARPQTPKVGCKVMVLYQLSCRFDAIEAEMVEQRFTQVQANRHIGFAWQQFQRSLNGRIEVNLAEQITGPESEIPGGVRELVTHGGNNVVTADLGKGEHALVGQEAVGMTEVADERRDRCLQPHFPRQVSHQRLQLLVGVVAKVVNRLGKQGYDCLLILVRLPCECLNDPKGMAEIEVLDVILVPIGLAKLPQRLPAPLGVPCEHFEPLTESLPLFGVEVMRVENVGVVKQKPDLAGVHRSDGAEVAGDRCR